MSKLGKNSDDLRRLEVEKEILPVLLYFILLFQKYLFQPYMVYCVSIHSKFLWVKVDTLNMLSKCKTLRFLKSDR